MIIIRYNSLTYEYIRDFIENKSNSGCFLLTPKEQYKDTHTLLKIICSCGDVFFTSFKRFSSKQSPKQKCNKCGIFIRNIGKRLSYEQVKTFIEIDSKSNYKLLSKHYSKSSSKLQIKCDKGHIFEMNYNNFKKGKRCPDCYGNRKYTYKEVFGVFYDNGCELLSKEYSDNKQKLSYLCECGNKSKISLSKFLQGERCNKCKTTRIMETLYKNGNVICSTQQKYLYDCLKGSILNYLFKNYFLDIAFMEEKIYVEYDGSGHDLSVKMNNITQVDFDKKESRRWYALYDSGWKEIRIISRKDFMPSDQKLLEIIEHAKEYLNAGHSWIKFDIDNSKIINSQGEFDYDYGELRKIKKEDVNIKIKNVG